jgi:2-polyprenyl-6-hydroxyphenyl methylase/3-demethylubiquinone-9 3-methyltransferase
MQKGTNVDLRETARYSALAAKWWDPDGPMRTLHKVNPLRLGFIEQNCELHGRHVIDIGCGGGVLAEPLTRLGARVTGVDLAEDLLGIAAEHARNQGLDIDYRYISAEDLADQEPGHYDVVTCMEVLEHVPRPKELVRTCAQLLKPGGHAFDATIDRNIFGLLFVIFGAEYILHLLPIGTHHYGNLIRPSELKAWGYEFGMDYAGSASVLYNLITRKFHLGPQRDPSYLMHLTKG